MKTIDKNHWILLLCCALMLIVMGCGEDDAMNESAYQGGADTSSQSSSGGTSSSGSWGSSSSGGGDAWSGSDTWGGGSSSGADIGGSSSSGGNTNVSLGGAQDFGYVRRLLDDNIVPTSDLLDASGFFAEHHTPLPDPVCGERVCMQAMLGVMGNLLDGTNCTMLQLGINSPITVNPDERPPLTLAVVVDTSGSMQDGDKIGFVRQGLTLLANELVDGDQIALIEYSTSARTLFPMQPIQGNRNALQSIINGLDANGGTNLHDGLREGFLEVFDNYDSGRQNRVIMISDGQPTEGITDAASILGMSRGYNSEGVGLTTIGLGTNFNYDLMRDLAQQGDGNFYFLEDSNAVDEVFTEELGYFTVPVAFDVSISVREGTDYSYVRATGSPLWEDTADGGQLEVPSVFLAHRVSSEDVHNGTGRRGGGSALLLELMPRPDDGTTPGQAQVATIDFTFREPGTNEVITDTIEVGYPESPWTIRASGYFENTIVEKSFVVLNVFVAMETSLDLFHAGEQERAIGLLQRLVAAVEDYNDSANDGMGDTDISLDLDLLLQMIEVMRANGAPEPSVEDIPEDPWPAD